VRKRLQITQIGKIDFRRRCFRQRDIARKRPVGIPPPVQAEKVRAMFSRRYFFFAAKSRCQNEKNENGFDYTLYAKKVQKNQDFF
jgi:hypothetical protein